MLLELHWLCMWVLHRLLRLLVLVLVLMLVLVLVLTLLRTEGNGRLKLRRVCTLHTVRVCGCRLEAAVVRMVSPAHAPLLVQGVRFLCTLLLLLWLGKGVSSGCACCWWRS